MSHALNYIPQPETPYRRLLSYVMPSRPWTAKVPGSWILDHVALRKLISLCPLCVHKFNPRRYGYVKLQHYVLGPYSDANCMDCRSHDPHCSSFVAEEFSERVNYREARRGRWTTVGAR